MAYTIDIDTGGTFTDGFFVCGERVETVKVPTTPHDLTICFLECIKAGAKRFAVSVEDLLYDTAIIRFSNTIGTNTIIQRDGSKIGLLVTSGSESLAPTASEDSAPPLVGADMVVGIEEQVSESGEVVVSPDSQAVLKAAQKLIDQGARCLVVCFANSEVNPANERLVRQVVKAEYPRDYLGSVPVFLSSDISRRSGLVERINSGVLNAYIHAKLVRLLYKAGEELRKREYPRSLFIVHNNGAVARVAKTRAINTYNSGPAAGLLGARLIGSLYGAGDVMSIDMGGTSFDLGYVRNGQPSYSVNPYVESLATNVPMLAIRAIGAGGGSIASAKDGKLQVGPQSAGALPGPVCFDLGGTEPTVADADLILGILDPNFFLGGSVKLNRDKAYSAMNEKVAKPLGVSPEVAALNIKRAVDEAMAREVINLKAELGSDFTPLMVVYGGAGPAHCCDIARISGISKIVITPYSAVFSAFSSSNMDVGHLYYRRMHIAFGGNGALKVLSQPLEEMFREAERDMRGEGYSADQVVSALELFVQSAGGGPEVKVVASANFFDDPAEVKSVIDRAQAALSDAGHPAREKLMVTTLGLMVQAAMPHYRIVTTAGANDASEKAVKGRRQVYLSDSGDGLDVAVYDRALLRHGHEVAGPAVIESVHTTFLLPSEWKMTVDQYNNSFVEEVTTR